MSDVLPIPTKESLADGNLREVRRLLRTVDNTVEWRPRWLDTSQDLFIVLGKGRVP